jgi:hypothetical protein
MTLPGGGADKLGNRYEGIWTVLQMLEVLEARAQSIHLEPPGVEGNGVEFILERETGRESHQTKIRSGNRWTLPVLFSEGVLTAFFDKLSAPNTKCVFVSDNTATELNKLARGARIRN